jgi:hypothetical protein
MVRYTELFVVQVFDSRVLQALHFTLQTNVTTAINHPCAVDSKIKKTIRAIQPSLRRCPPHIYRKVALGGNCWSRSRNFHQIKLRWLGDYNDIFRCTFRQRISCTRLKNGVDTVAWRRKSTECRGWAPVRDFAFRSWQLVRNKHWKWRFSWHSKQSKPSLPLVQNHEKFDECQLHWRTCTVERQKACKWYHVTRKLPAVDSVLDIITKSNFYRVTANFMTIFTALLTNIYKWIHSVLHEKHAIFRTTLSFSWTAQTIFTNI